MVLAFFGLSIYFHSWHQSVGHLTDNLTYLNDGWKNESFCRAEKCTVGANTVKQFCRLLWLLFCADCRLFRLSYQALDLFFFSAALFWEIFFLVSLFCPIAFFSFFVSFTMRTFHHYLLLLLLSFRFYKCSLHFIFIYLPILGSNYFSMFFYIYCMLLKVH